MEYTEPPPPYPGQTKTIQFPRDIPLPAANDFEELYRHKHTMLATAASGARATVHHWRWEDGELQLSSVPTSCMPGSFGIVERVEELGLCKLPPGSGDGNDAWVERLVETLVTDVAEERHGRAQRAALTTASVESDELAAWIRKHNLSYHPQPSQSETTAITAGTSTTPTPHVQAFALPVFSKSPSVLVAGKGPHMVWGKLEASRPRPAGGGWCVELNEYLWHWELGPDWADVYRKYPIRLLATGVTDETYEMMVGGEGRPVGLVP